MNVCQRVKQPYLLYMWWKLPWKVKASEQLSSVVYSSVSLMTRMNVMNVWVKSFFVSKRICLTVGLLLKVKLLGGW